MNRLIALFFITTCLFIMYPAVHAFTPMEFLQHLQRQQQMQQQDMDDEEEQGQTAKNNQQPHPQQIQQKQPVPQTEKPQIPQEIFKPYQGEAPLIIKGCFTFANETNQNEKMPSFRVYFKGKETMSDEEGFFSFPVDENNLKKYRIVITKTIQYDVDKHNTIKDFKLIPDKSYKCYSFRRLNAFGKQWEQHEKDLRKKHFIIPNNAIVVLIDPKYVEGLEPWDLNLARNFIKLPKIVLKREVKHKATQRAAAKSLLTSLDAAVFHEEVREEEKHPSEKVKMTLNH